MSAKLGLPTSRPAFCFLASLVLAQPKTKPNFFTSPKYIFLYTTKPQNIQAGLKVGEAGSFIRFYCDNCGYKSTVSESYAGKQIRCPKCYYIIHIPKAQPKVTTPNQNGSEQIKTTSKDSDYDLTLLNISEKEKLSTFQRGQTSISEETYECEPEIEEELIDERRLPWLIDIFLYPFSVPGLKSLAIFIGVPLLINILGTILPIQLSCLFFLVTIVINIVIFFYIYWYFVECVRDSADGGGASTGGIRCNSRFYGYVLADGERNWLSCNFFYAVCSLYAVRQESRHNFLAVTNLCGFAFSNGIASRCYVRFGYRP